MTFSGSTVLFNSKFLDGLKVLPEESISKTIEILEEKNWQLKKLTISLKETGAYLDKSMTGVPYLLNTSMMNKIIFYLKIHEDQL